MKAWSVPAAVALLLLLPAAPASASDVSTQDREYLNRTHQANLYEIITGNLVDRAACLPVRQLGPRLVAHHTALDVDLVTVATREGVTLYSVPDPGQLAQIAALGSRSGADFDAAWLRDQIEIHVRGLASTEWELRYGWSREVKALAARSEPVLRKHLEEATEAINACGVPGS